MSLAARVYAIGRALASVAPATVQDRLLRLKPFSMQSGIWHLPNQGLAYVMNHKVATRSVLSALTSLATGLESGREATYDEVRAAMKRYQRGAFPPEIRRLADSCFTFTFVRNPLDRLLSAYTHQMAADSQKTILRQHGIRSDATFAEFVEVVAQLPDEGCNVHVRSQHRFVSDADGVFVEYVGRFEQLDAQWSALADRFGLPHLPHRHAYAHPPLAEAYTRELARLAAQRYARDIELFGYGDEITQLT